MLKKESLYLAVILACVTLCVPALALSQDAAPSSRSQAEKPAEEKAMSRPPLEQYHLNFSLNELEDGKKINSRQYSMDLDTNASQEIKIGTRVPVEVKDGEFQYIDMGTNIFARIGVNREQTELNVHAETSSFATEPNPADRHNLSPAVRQLKMGGTVLLPLSKPVIIGSAADPNSRREFQLEVAVTKIR